jgi:hypothetical protein
MKNNKTYFALAKACALLAALFGLCYSVAFVVLKSDLLSALFLLLSALVVLVVMTALSGTLREADASFALLAFVLGAGAAAGSIIHGGSDLSNALHPPASLNTDPPSPIDPRGLLTFGVAGLTLLLFSWLMAQAGLFPKGLSYLGYVSAALMIVPYLGRLIILQATSPAILLPALLEGFLVNPIWYLKLGLSRFGQK